MSDGLAREIEEKALVCGFDRCGIVPISAIDGFAELFDKRIADVPESQYFYAGLNGYAKPRERFPWANSIVVLLFYYGKYRFPASLQGEYAKAFFLEPERDDSPHLDLDGLESWFRAKGIRAEGGRHLGEASVGPLRYLAMKAGLGTIRTNNFFYTERGSYYNLFGYAIDAECELFNSVDLRPCPETCNRCRDACRTCALEARYVLNPFNCVSFLTTFGNCDVPEGLTDEMYGTWVCGCDDCQDACPFNMRHDWDEGLAMDGLDGIAQLIQPERYDSLSDDFLVREVVSRSAHHLTPDDVGALRKNSARAAENKKKRILE